MPESPTAYGTSSRRLRPPLGWPLPVQYGVALGLMAATLGLGWILPDIGRTPFLLVLAPLLPLVVLVRTGPFLAAAGTGIGGSAVLFIPPFGDAAPAGMVDWTLPVLIAVALAGATCASFLATRAQDEHQRTAVEQAKVRQAAGVSVERLRVAKAAAGLGLHDYDVVANRVEWDEQTRALWGVEPDEAITYETWRDSLHHDDRAAAEDAVADALDPEKGGAYFAEFRVRNRRDGVVRWIQATGSTTFSDGEPVRLVGTVRDVTARKRGEAALREADRRKDEFLAMLAHELRNPLGPIRTASTLLPKVRDDPERFQEASGIIQRQSATIARLVDDLLDMSRITRGKIKLQKERIDLAPLVHEAIDLVRTACEASEVELNVDVTSSPLPIEGDRVRMAQVLNNLLTNACKYTDPGGRITVTVEEDEGSCVIRVRDTGIGITSENLARIFDLFAQVDGNRGGTGGLGIGLSLVERLVELHGGTITAESDGLGTGSEFTIHLPLAEAAGKAPAHPSRDGEEPGETEVEAAGQQVLLVDDHPDALEPMRILLEFKGHRVRTAITGQEALDAAKEHHPEVIVLDIGLPDMDGYEVARRIRALPWGESVFLVALTGWGQAEDKRQAAEAGFDRHLTKPADPTTLEELIRTGHG